MNISGIMSTDYITTKTDLAQDETKVNNFQSILENAVKTEDDAALKDACKQVEHYMLASIFKQMKESTTTGETLIEKGDYEKMFEDYLVEEQCKEMVEAGGIGLADMMYKQMLKAYNA